MTDDMNGNGSHERIFDEIMEFLRQLNWPRDPLSGHVIRTYYRGEFGLSEVMIHIGAHDICMIIDPVVERSVSTWGEAVVKLIANMEEEIRHIGMGFDAEGDLYVKVHLAHAHINLERFYCLLLGLCQVAENMLLPVLQANAFDHLKVA
jgi:hypothetical protein